MDIRLLGNVEVEADGVLLDVGSPKARAVFTVLVLHVNEVVSTDRIIDLVWGDDPPRTAAHSVQLYVSELRRTLEGQVVASIETRSPGYSLRIHPESIDVHRFGRLVDHGSALFERGDHGAAVRTLREALDLWRGAPLGDFAYEDFAQHHIRRLDELKLAAEVDLAAAELEVGNLRTALRMLERIVEEHPLRERPVELLMLALYRQGRQAEALRAYDAVRKRLAEELGIDPSPQLSRLEQLVLEQDSSLRTESAARPSWSGNLPADVTSFVGRHADLAELENIAGRSRLLTFLGPGGIGKSRLALELARRLAPQFDDGVWLVELGTIVDPSSIAGEIAALWRRAEEFETIEDLAALLSDRQALLLLDNCDRVVAGVAKVAERLLQTAPDLHIVATSREPLECRGEVLWRVDPLDLISSSMVTTPAGAASEAAELFVERARDANPRLSIDGDASASVSSICAMLEGIPLAIELAASQLRGVTLAELHGQLDDQLGLLVSSDRNVPARQQTLERTIEWSYDLLDSAERELFTTLGDFSVEFPLRAIEVACASDAIAEETIAPLVARLVDKSLLVRLERGGRTWYRLLDTVRAFAFRRFVGPGDSPGRGFLMHLAGRTDRNLRGSIDEMWSALLGGNSEIARDALTLAANRFREDQGGELAGIIAALVSKNDSVGYICGMKPAEIPADRGDGSFGARAIMRRFRDGFVTGAQRVNPQIEIAERCLTEEIDFAAAFENPRRGGELAAIMLADGADVIFHAAGHSGSRMFEIARRVTEDTGTHRWVIGVDFDQYRDVDAALRPHVLASIRKQVPTDVFRQIKQAVAAGRVDEAPWFDVANGGLAVATSGGHIDHLASVLESARAEIIARKA